MQVEKCSLLVVFQKLRLVNILGPAGEVFEKIPVEATQTMLQISTNYVRKITLQ